MSIEWDYDVPEPLNKALSDEFVYMLGMRDGCTFTFSSAHRVGNWLELKGIVQHSVVGNAVNLNEDDRTANFLRTARRFHPCFERGVWVRIAEICWCADAPHGS